MSIPPIINDIFGALIANALLRGKKPTGENIGQVLAEKADFSAEHRDEARFAVLVERLNPGCRKALTVFMDETLGRNQRKQFILATSQMSEDDKKVTIQFLEELARKRSYEHMRRAATARRFIRPKEEDYPLNKVGKILPLKAVKATGRGLSSAGRTARDSAGRLQDEIGNDLRDAGNHTDAPRPGALGWADRILAHAKRTAENAKGDGE